MCSAAPEVGTGLSTWKYFKVDGSARTDNPLFSIGEYLASNEDYSAVSCRQFERELGIDLTDPRNSGLLDSLSRNPKIKVTQAPSGAPMIARRQELGVECSQDLRRLFESRLPPSVPVVGSKPAALGVTDDQLAGAFPGVELELDDMIASGRVAFLVSKKAGSSREGCVFFPNPPGVQAPAFLRDIWNGTKLPCKADIKQHLLKNGLRAHCEYAERDQRAKRRREAERESAKQPNKTERVCHK